ncbi:Tetratricopeptide repeat superfamily protein [Heracleum sosnowskyi]|uniref:Tetratricopeptide repeat superfamily protein n=1 Tax=Heracleum sosnowskyi TaxID=360622 RepID=A0AAD8HYF0_9APIA|nr:Tetratricopeptide repeat superfamily protein [Heracleum sosnowskyi]
METLIPNSLIPPKFIYYYPSLYNHKVQNFINFPHKRLHFYPPKTVTFCSSPSSNSLSYGGWDDMRLGGDSVVSGESNQLSNFMNYIGLNDKKFVFVYLLGFVCALAVSRVRVSSIIVIPACAVVFAVGFSFGFVNNGFSLIGSEKKVKFDDNVDVVIEKMNNLMGLFRGLDGRIVELRNDIRSCLRDNRVTVDDLERYVVSTETIGSSALTARNIAQECVDSLLVENQEVEQMEKQHSSKRKKGSEGKRFDLSQFLASMFQEKSANTKANRLKDFDKESTNMKVDDARRVSILAPTVEERRRSSVSGGSVVYGRPRLYKEKPDLIAETGRMNMSDFEFEAGRVFESKEYNYENNRTRFVANEKISRKTGEYNTAKAYTSGDDLFDLEFNVSQGMRTKSSFRQEPEKMESNENFVPSESVDQSSEERYETRVRETVTSEDESSDTSSRSAQESEFASSTSSKVIDDILFNRYLMEANTLLKQARESIKNRGDERDVENALQETALILSKAVELKPMSLLAMGQLGNTYLLHGELKLKVSRELRARLWRSNASLFEEDYYSNELDGQACSKEELASVLINVCQECEELLVEAGRKYRSALSIDGDDMRALYNWGLALSFRAQLIADIGPEAALDADKVFLAAIDKFDAMMSKSNTHAPDALFRWGVALQQRSRLRTRNSREKVKLLRQAKRLYEDALDMDSDNLQVRKALVSCISEMNYRI